ncbi:MAG: response regulator transcription factor [Chitinophagales bacterium]|nr:response regulator transcription factor [Chitinophagales bacterium]
MSNLVLNFLIVEDDLLFAVELEMLLQEIGYEATVRVDNSSDALEVLYSNEIDFILMDIDIKGKLSGIEIGQKTRHLNIPILYITSLGNDEHYEAAQKSNMAGYLVKPIDKYSLRTAIDLAINNILLSQKYKYANNTADEFIFEQYLFFKKRRIYHKVKIDDITIVEGADDYVQVYLKNDNKFLSRKTMRAMENLLSLHRFVRVHRSYLVHIDAIQSIDFQNQKLFIGDIEIPISRNRKKQLEELVNKID